MPIVALLLPVLLVAPLPTFAAEPRPSPAPPARGPEGAWDTPAGRVELARDGERVTGRIVAPRPGGPFAAGELVLQGTFVEDSVAARVRPGLVAPGCGALADEAWVTLLLTRSGRLTGALASRAPCAAATTSVTFTRAAPADAAPGRVMLGPPAAQGAYDPRGQGADAFARLMHDGAAWLQEGRFEKARERFLEAIRLRADRGEAYNGVGVSFYARNDYDQAIEWYKRGLEADPGHPDLYYNLACAYALVGKKHMALRYLRLAALKGWTEVDALDKDPDWSALREARDPGFLEVRQLMVEPPPPLPVSD